MLTPPRVICTTSLESLGPITRWASVMQNNTIGAGTRYLVPFRLRQPATYTHMFLRNGASATDNYDLGVYDEKGTLLGSTGSFAQNGTATVVQAQALSSPLRLGPGTYYMGIVSQGGTGDIQLIGVSDYRYASAMGITQGNSIAFPLATDVLIATGSGFIPIVGLSMGSVTT